MSGLLLPRCIVFELMPEDSLSNVRMEVTAGIEKFALYETGKVVIYVANNLHS